MIFIESMGNYYQTIKPNVPLLHIVTLCSIYRGKNSIKYQFRHVKYKNYVCENRQNTVFSL